MKTNASEIMRRYGVSLGQASAAIPVATLRDRKVYVGAAYIDKGCRHGGIVASVEVLPSVSGGSRLAEVIFSAASSDSEMADLANVAREYVRANPPAGSQYDPASAPRWAEWRSDLASMTI